MQLVLSRIALLDIFVAFFMLLAVHCHVADRDWYRARLARLTADTGGQVANGTGPVRALVFRPWLIAAGVSWGLACGSKWEAAYPLAAFGLLDLLLERRGPTLVRRPLGARPVGAGRRRTCLPERRRRRRRSSTPRPGRAG